MANLKTGFGRTGTGALTIKVGTDSILRIGVCDDMKAALQTSFARMAYVARDETATIARAQTALAGVIGAWGIEVLMQVGSGALGEGVVVIENLPFENVAWSPVPGAPARSAKSTDMSELLLLGFGGFLGEPYGVESEGQRLVNDLIPSTSDLQRFTGNGSRLELGMHVENAALKHLQPGRDWSPKALMLTGVSAQKIGGPTTPVAVASRAVARLSQDDRALLRTACVDIAVPERQRAAFASGETVGPLPVILGRPGRETLVAAFYGDMMRARCGAAEAAIQRLDEAVQAVSVQLEVLPGQIVYVANGRALHGRSQFEPEFDDMGRARRWIQRIFLTGRLDELRDAEAVSDRVFRIGN